MTKDVAILIIKSVSSLVAMILIWRLVETAIQAGLDGVVFFTGMATIAGLGGYEIRWLIDTVRGKAGKGDKNQ